MLASDVAAVGCFKLVIKSHHYSPICAKTHTQNIDAHSCHQAHPRVWRELKLLLTVYC